MRAAHTALATIALAVGVGVTAARPLPAPYSTRGIAEIAQLARLGLPLFCGGLRGRDVALTFDDGPGPYTPLALRILRRAGAEATFFVVGRNIARFPGDLRAETRLAVVGDHTWDHLDLVRMSRADATSQIARTALAEQSATGRRTVLFRPPYGARDTMVDGIARTLGLLEVVWDVSSADSAGADWQQIARNVTRHLRPGDIVLMHENRGQTIRALRYLILPALQRLRLRPVSLETLLAVDPPSRPLLREGYGGCLRR
ncbi:MAG: polysaccharide deacetylase family protein [Actinobacteria bacterium]|nr:MAG: polysaccharide deacetylase family protein [Actinomycetota bacterium]